MTMASMLASSRWSRLSADLQVIVTGGGALGVVSAFWGSPLSLKRSRPPWVVVSGATSSTSSRMALAVLSIAQS